MNNKFNKDDVVLYKNGDTYELGVISIVVCRIQMPGKEWREPLCTLKKEHEQYVIGYDYLVFYHTGNTTALTSEELLIPINNTYAFTIIRKSVEDGIRYSPARQLASRILGQTELYGEFYYRMEDWLTKFLEGDEHDLPSGIESEYLRMALRVEVRNYFDSNNAIGVEPEDIENVINELFKSFSQNVFNTDFIWDTVRDYIDRNNIKCESENE